MVLAIILMLLIFYLPQGVLGYFEELFHHRSTTSVPKDI
jgi:hypothetical protein